MRVVGTLYVCKTNTLTIKWLQQQKKTEKKYERGLRKKGWEEENK